MNKHALRWFCLGSVFLWSFAAQAQQAVWVKVASGQYLGGSGVMNFRFDVPVETMQIALTVPAFCAPRALASRATILEDDTSWVRTVDLRFMRQERFNGLIRAFYTLDDSMTGYYPLVSGVKFSFVQVNSQQQSVACAISVFALHGQ